jgi:predicted Zn-dependent peptidase
LEDVKSFYKSRYTAAGSAIAVVGDFKASEMKKKITDLWGTWQTPKSAPALAQKPSLSFGQSQVLLINKDDSHETRFYIGGAGVPRNHPDYVAIQVVNTILGGRFTSWLNTELRINSGLSYGARSNFDTKRLAGTFVMSSFTATPTIRAIDLALAVLDSLHRHGPNAATLESARNYILGGFAPDYETGLQLASLLTDFHAYGIDERFINTFRTQVMAVDVARAKEIIAKYFPKDKLQFVVIGKGSEIRKDLSKYGKLTEKEIRAEGY